MRMFIYLIIDHPAIMGPRGDLQSYNKIQYKTHISFHYYQVTLTYTCIMNIMYKTTILQLFEREIGSWNSTKSDVIIGE